MRGIIILTSILAIIFAGSIGLPATSPAEEVAGVIGVLLSDSEGVYTTPLKAFKAEVGSPVKVFNLQGDIRKDPGVKQKLLSIHPKAIFALGAKAAYAAKIWTEDRLDIPVIFALVFNWQRYDLLTQKNMVGIAAEIFGFELHSREIDRSKEFRRSFREVSRKVDAFWVLNDPVVYTLDNMDWLKIRCLKQNLPCIGQSRNIVELGLVLAINPDMANMGAQAASLARNMIARTQQPRGIGVMDPLGTQIYINRSTAKRIGLELDQSSLDMATLVID